VPLRTYLPDGDIDVCLLGPHELLAKDHWTTRLRAHIERAEAAAAAAAKELDTKPNEFAVSEIHVIHAEVKLMKCIADGVVVDISANQFGGLATLGFLEEVDAFIGRGSIFKRSIILIKAWGFYESRVLGAHHALISTYALETLVLYVLNAYHEELTTPLEVLHKFLTFFAEFDWDTHAVSIHGPVPLDELDGVRSLPTDAPAGLLLTPEFLWRMLDKYGNDSIMRRVDQQSAGSARSMPAKYLNVVDPLLPSNNLGRSVSQGNAKRIRKALRLGAERLSALRADNATRDDAAGASLLEAFFGNTMRHRRLTPLPHAPTTPGGREHADEVSITPAAGRGAVRDGSVSVLASPPSSYSASRRKSKKKSAAKTAEEEGEKGASKDAADEDDIAPKRLDVSLEREGGMADAVADAVADVVADGASEGGSDGGDRSSTSGDASGDSSSDGRWPHLGPPSPDRSVVGSGCPIVQTADIRDEERGPFWGRWEPLPEAELAAAAAAAEAAIAEATAMADEHFPRLGRGGEGRCPVAHGNAPDGKRDGTNDRGKASASARDGDAAIAAAAMMAAVDSAATKCPRHARGLSRDDDDDDDDARAGILARGDSVKSGVSFGAGADASAAAAGSLLGDSPTKALSESGDAAVTANAPPPPPPGPPPPGAELSARREAAVLRMRREMSCPTFFPEPMATHPPPPAHPPMPPPAVTPTHELGLCERSAPPRDIFAGDLDSIWKHLEFGRLYHHLAIQKRFVQMQSAGVAGGRGVGGRGGRGGFVRGGGRGGRGHVRTGSSGGHSHSHSAGASPRAGAANAFQPQSQARARFDPNAPPPPPGAPVGRSSGSGRNADSGRAPRAPRGGSRDASAGVAGSRGGKSSTTRDVAAGAAPPPLPPGAAPPLPPGPPPSVAAAKFAAAEAWASAESERGPAAIVAAAKPPSWGPKGAAALDAIKRAPDPSASPKSSPAADPDAAVAKDPKDEAKAKDEAAETSGEDASEGGDAGAGEASSSSPAAETSASAVPPALTNAVGAKGSWSSLVARDVAASPKRDATAAARTTKSATGAGSNGAPNGAPNGASPVSPPSEPTPSGSTTPASPARPLAGAWAKGPVTTALKKDAAVASKPPSPPSASAAGSPASSSSEDSNSTENENKAPGGKNVAGDANGGDANDDADADAMHAAPKKFAHNEDDFPGLISVGGSKKDGGNAAPLEESAGRGWGAGGGAWASRVAR
jgi:hypothetical protein